MRRRAGRARPPRLTRPRPRRPRPSPRLDRHVHDRQQIGLARRAAEDLDFVNHQVVPGRLFEEQPHARGPQPAAVKAERVDRAVGLVGEHAPDGHEGLEREVWADDLQVHVGRWNHAAGAAADRHHHLVQPDRRLQVQLDHDGIAVAGVAPADPLQRFEVRRAGHPIGEFAGVELARRVGLRAGVIGVRGTRRGRDGIRFPQRVIGQVLRVREGGGERQNERERDAQWHRSPPGAAGRELSHTDFSLRPARAS